MISTITLDGNTVTLVALPSCPAPKMVEPWINDSVAMITSPFTGKTQRQGSTGADLGGMMVTYPPMYEATAAPILAWMAQMRGMARAVQMTPPEYTVCAGSPAGTPVVDSSVVTNNVAASTTLVTRGWKASTRGLLLPWDLIQVGYGLYRVLDMVNSDADGKASFEIFPSLRWLTADATPIIIANPKGLYGLGQNKRNYSVGLRRIVSLSFPLVEYR
jgi:hypothetical protein